MRLIDGALVLALIGAGSTALPSEAATGPSWSSIPVAGGYQVTLHLDQPLHGRDALPELAVNGVPVGAANESPDGRTLTTFTTNSHAARPLSVQLAWNGRVSGSSTGQQPSATLPPAQPVTADPTTTGPYAVQRADYDFGDTAITLPGLNNKAVENRAAVWVPVGAPGRRPVVILLHGRHDSCFQPNTTNSTDDVWPCPAGWSVIPSNLGFAQSAEKLATDGFVVVSISANGVNAFDNSDSEDAGALAHGQLVLRHLDLLAAANVGTAPGLSPLLKGRLDLTNIGLMGHSRGGEGVVKADLLNAALPHPYGIRSVLLIAPVDYSRQTVPGVPMAVVLPYCDGDVSDLRGQHFYDDTRYADQSDHVLRASVLVMGANHNFFNTEWTPGLSPAPAFDDWDAEVDPADPTCGSAQPTTTRLTAAQQNDVGTAYATGFFRMTMAGESAFLPMFANPDGSVVSVGAATVVQENQSPQRIDISALTAPSNSVTIPAGATYCASMSGLSPQSGLPSCTDSPDNSRFPAFTPQRYAQNVTAAPMLHLPTAGTVVASLGNHDISGYRDLTVRAALDSGPAALTLTVTDGAGRQQSLAAQSLTPFPGSGTILPKTWLRTLSWPVSQLRAVNIRDISRVSLSASAGVLLSDLAVQTPAVGAGGPSTLPQLSISGTTVDPGSGTATVTVTLSRPSRLPVIANIQTVAGAGTQLTPGARVVVIPAGQTTASVGLPVTDNGSTADTTYLVVLSDPTNAIVGGSTFAHVVVRG
ncbi:hypothetical protein [Kutzneria sp. 744]|uniref:hypothetical protein n=1 Tax=Kutzneria sp. (strain 744) TaxID=345341 RepID=UPI0003EEB2B5|nr:hypothetical protein [Kutzneria sp. 744]EWM12520.1 secreted protein [Kutzneria sp. 744]